MNYRKELPSIEYLFECFDPDFIAGSLVWKERPSSHFKTSQAHSTFLNTRSGAVAGHVSKFSGYRIVTLSGSSYLMHRILWKMYYKKEPPLIIDHKDECKLNNSIANLLESNRRVNKVKSSKVVNGSGYRGVYKRKDRSSYEVRLSLPNSLETGKKDIHIGYYHNKLEAAAAYNIAVRLMGLGDNYYNQVDYPEDEVNTNKKFFKENNYHTY